MNDAERKARIRQLEARQFTLLNELVSIHQQEYLRKQKQSASPTKSSAPAAYYAASVNSQHTADPMPCKPGAAYITDQAAYSVPDTNPASTPILPGHTLTGSSVQRMNPNEVASLLYAQQQLHAAGATLPESTPESGAYTRMREVERAIPLRDPVRTLVQAAGTPYGIPGAGDPTSYQIPDRVQEYTPKTPARGPTRQFPDIFSMLQGLISR